MYEPLLPISEIRQRIVHWKLLVVCEKKTVSNHLKKKKKIEISKQRGRCFQHMAFHAC